MKKLLVLYLILPYLVSATADPAKGQKSTITKATVYYAGAQIERSSSVTLNKGDNIIELNNLSPFIDENSIQFSGLGNTSIVSVNYTTTLLFTKTDSEKLSYINKQIKIKQNTIATLESLQKGLTEEETLLTSNRKLLSEENTSLTKLQEFATYYRKRITQISTEKYTNQTTIDSLETILTDYRTELQKVQSGNKEQKGIITVNLHSDTTATLQLTFTYNVTQAGWFPVYDIKATDTHSNLSINFKAHVFQDTGEDWTNVKVTLSTADPTVPSDKPEMVPHYLNFINSYTKTKALATTNSTYKYNPFIKKVTGVVTENGNPLPGVSVFVKGTTNGTTTDFDGKYTLDINNGQSITYSYVGYKNKEIPVYAPLINIALEEDYNQLEEVVVVGYGTKAEKALKGMTPGVQTNSGNNTLRIRGNTSFNNNTQPLYIVDGIPVDSNYFQSLNQNEIKNVQVLNDASETAIYGSRAVNGVILITTKDVEEIQNITTREYTLKKPQTIASVMDITVLEIDNLQVQAEYEYIAAPVLNESVFLTAKLQEWTNLNLLPGEANIYFSGTFINKSYINPYGNKEDLVLSLGVAPAITVKRELDNNFKSKSFLGSSRIVARGYIISLQNTTKEAIEVTLLDRIPVSQNKEIKVDEVTHDADTYDEDKGLLTWKIKLDPGAHTEKHLTYEIKYPKEQRVNLD